MNYTLKEVKQYLKENSLNLRILKVLRKQEGKDKDLRLKSFDPSLVEELKTKLNRWQIEDLINSIKNDVRHHHIAYCLFRGRTIEQIESNPKKGHNSNTVERIQNLIKNAMEELNNERTKTLCVG